MLQRNLQSFVTSVRHRRGGLCLAALLLAPFAAAATAGDDASTSPSLAAEVPMEVSLESGETRSFSVELAAGASALFTVEQRGIDVTLRLEGPAGEPHAEVDAPFDRQGEEALLLEPRAAGRYRVVIAAREKGAPAGRVELTFHPLSRSVPEELRRLEAWRAMTRAGEGYRAGTPEARRGALAAYGQAREGWHALGDRPLEARALYAQAVLSRLLDDTRAALERAQEDLPLWQGAGDRLWEGVTWNEVGLDRWLLGDAAGARQAFERALALDRAEGERYGAAVALANLCLLHLPKGELREGLACYREALPLLREVRALELEGAALTNVGRAYDVLGEPSEARAAYGEALTVLRDTGNRAAEGRTLNNLGVLEAAAGDVEGALIHYAQARDIFRALGDRRWQARVLNNLGLVYHGSGDFATARSNYDAALPLWLAVGDEAGEAATRTNLGLILQIQGRPREALAFHTRALAIRRAAGDRRGEAIALTQLARTQRALGDLTAALEGLEHAADLLAAVGDPDNLSYAQLLAGEVLAAQGRREEALVRVGRALATARGAGSPIYEAQALSALAAVEGSLGRSKSACEHALAALDRIEALRVRIGDPDLRISYSGFQHRAYELAIDLLMAAHRAAPTAGYDREALGVSERARARTLFELLQEAHVDLRQKGDAPLLDRLAVLEDRLSAKAERLSRLGAGAAGGAGSEGNRGEREALQRESQEIVQELDLVEARLRQGDPQVAALTRPRPLTAPEIQGLLDPDTILLSYALGEARSYLWMVTAEELQSFELPPRAAVEEAARRLHEGWSRFDVARRGATGEVALALGRTLLGPIAGRLARLTGGRLAVVADGALEYVPFSALPLEPEDGKPLLARHEVVYLPSASVLALERQLRAGRPQAERRLAVLADPVFDVRDPRVVRPRGGAPLPAPSGPPPFERLPASRREAEAIAVLAGSPGGTMMALDFAAARSAVLGDRLAPFQVVHFATHGVLDAEHPALSGLALSTVDREGRPQEGFLDLRDIYGLRLGADLVVLSGCRTALGREVKGEGLMGLARGFLSAGAPRVVASLWPVEDRATAALMTRFYRALWQEGLPPAAALRAAQLAVRGERRWRDPYFWAGFVLEGAWD
jgi:CHAT domain-containing protein/tetratricopeptide (TPR) repeat protein